LGSTLLGISFLRLRHVKQHDKMASAARRRVQFVI